MVSKSRKIWLEKNKERLKELKKKYYEENKERCITRVKLWKKNNPDKVKMSREKSKKHDREFCKARNKTFIGKIRLTYYHMKARSRKKGFKRIIKLEKFIIFCKKDKNFRILFKNWKKSNYEYKLCLSIDRIDNNKGYVKGNLQFLTISDNSKKGHIETCSGKKKVKIEKNNIILKFESMREASRFIGGHVGLVGGAIFNNRKAKGWSCTLI